MDIAQADFSSPSIKIYHELMGKKVGDILLVSSPYDAFIMEEEGRLSNRIIHEYKGLNLSKPPRLTWISSAEDAFLQLEKKHFDLILAMPSLDGMDVYAFGEEVKKRYSELFSFYCFTIPAIWITIFVKIPVRRLTEPISGAEMRICSWPLSKFRR